MKTDLIKLKNRIMRRVYAIWFAREAVPKVLVIGACSFIWYRVAAYRFFWAQIFENMASSTGQSLWNLPRFIAAALNSAEPHFLIILSGLGIVSFLLAIKLLRSIRVILKQGYFSSSFTANIE